MGSLKDQLMDIEAERFDEWLEDNYPDVVPNSEEWELAANLYYWEQEALADQAQWDHEHGLFVASLNNIQQRYQHAVQEIKQLWALLDNPQPELVYRMSFVHAVTVMEAYLMYCARALLEHDWPLERYFEVYYLPFARADKKEKQAARKMPLSTFRPVARNVVASMTFHNVKTIERYFGTVLHIPPIWPTEPLGIIADWRNDLVHRNGVDEHDVPRVISVQQLQNALQKVSDLIEAAHLSLRLELDYFGNWRTEENREIIASALNIHQAGEAS
ncbi:hypothetical protein OU757_004232 [Yersinia enterocolitica]|nr:hypothetical protein [Yersinia enterocolitica]EKN3769142.1 hypothetical protein [Yersinia enterocolitica]EKN4084122.1 hypothetical protein [Yersinia enterocolitica]EKN6170219.1 hypothetical protein [Yersinia enterocolitica]EKN6397866.1 hypothetical protein [Yersinia enterocolitica]